MRYVRIDDFPHGHRDWWHETGYRGPVAQALQVFEEEQVPYVLGVSPLIFADPDVDFLNEHVKTGKTCLHGFSHFFEYSGGPWGSVVGTWADGGEFAGRTVDELAKSLVDCLEVCAGIDSFTPTHFIPPFNAFTQDLVSVLHRFMPDCQYIHTCDTQWHQYRQYDMVFHGMVPVIASEGDSYADAYKIVQQLKEGRGKHQITLHWACDMRSRPDCWQDDYRELCKLLKEKSDDSVP